MNWRQVKEIYNKKNSEQTTIWSDLLFGKINSKWVLAIIGDILVMDKVDRSYRQNAFNVTNHNFLFPGLFLEYFDIL